MEDTFIQKSGNYKKLFKDFNQLKILIIGDVMVDSYLWGKVERISAEAPIPMSPSVNAKTVWEEQQM